MKIGVFDSGIGGLTVLKEIRKVLPQYDYIYLGDNARTPYGSRSFEVVYQYTWSAVQELFKLNCNLVILACNTASAKALRTIQQNNLKEFQDKKVLGVIRPCTESASEYTKSGHIGILATEGTVKSASYEIEINKFFPDIQVTQLACPMWVPLVENQAYDNAGGEYFIQESLKELFQTDPKIDSIVLACTHYPILENTIKKFTGDKIRIVSQGRTVAKKLKDYLDKHKEIEGNLEKTGTVTYYTSENPELFNEKAGMFLGEQVSAIHLEF